MPSLEQLEWSPVPLVNPVSNPVIEKEIKKSLGFIPSSIPYTVTVQWMVDWQIFPHLYPTIHLPRDLSRLVSLVVAMDNSCRYCYGSFRSMMKILGYKEEWIRQMEENLSKAEVHEQDRPALEFVRKFTKAAPRPNAADFSALEKAGFSSIQIAELSYEAAMMHTGTRIATLLALPPDPIEGMAKNPFVRALRPLIGWGMRQSFRKHHKPAPEFENTGPGREIVETLKGSPAAYALRKVLDGAWHSEITTQRTKALIFAVIARALGCPTCESEACGVLRTQGLAPEDIDYLLLHLSSTRLEPFELKVIQFVRETVHYQVKHLQDKVREFSVGLDPSVVLEVCGLAALANGMARLSVLLNRV